jgi:hypothetical protein
MREHWMRDVGLLEPAGQTTGDFLLPETFPS